jgi:hypothetical protein
MTELVEFHQRGGLWYAFLGVHVVALARDGEWISWLDGDLTWRQRTDLDACKAAISEHVRQWYDAAHQPLAAGQAERLCKTPRQFKPKQIIKINPVDLEEVALRLKRDGVVTTYTMPPVVDAVEPPQATLTQARMFCISVQETAQNKCRAAPDDALASHELAVFAGLVRMIDACTSSDIIKAELKRIAKERNVAESTRVETDRPADAEGLSA